MLQPNPPFHNLLLQELPEPDFDSIAPYLETRSFKQGTVLFEAGAEQERVYFPFSGMVSLVTVMRSGHSIETAVVGREGFVGAVPKVDVSFRYIRAIVLLPATIYVLPLDLFVKAMAERPALHDMSVRHNESLLAQIRITAACNALHQASARVCRILLRAAEVAGSDVLPMKQELLSDILGVRRTSITDIALHLKSQGIIAYKRGNITILNRAALRSECCECYDIQAEQSAALVSQSSINRRPQNERKADVAELQNLRNWPDQLTPSFFCRLDDDVVY